MKTGYRIIYIQFVLYFVCHTVFAQGSWMQKANFGGTARRTAVGFSIGTKGYIGTGNDGIDYPNDFWEWDQSNNFWTQKANFAGPARQAAVGFSVGSKGYIGTGVDLFSAYLKDFWEYDPVLNLWVQKADFLGVERYFASGFSIGGKGYIGLGGQASSPPFYNDFWEWDQATDTWTQKANFVGAARLDAVGFSIGSKGYIGAGYNGVAYNDFWEFDPLLNSWVQKANFGGAPKYAVIGFSIATKGYMGTGYNTGLNNDFWEYNPVDTINGFDGNGNPMGVWIAKANFGGTARYRSVGFSIGCKGYVGIGDDGSYTQDFWEYNPSDIINNNISSQNLACSGQCTATATATPVGGTGTYTYLWSNTQITQTITGLCAGTYNLVITDSLGCNGMDSVIISEPPALTTTVYAQTDVTCNGGNNGTATVLPQGGVPVYTYFWSWGSITAIENNLFAGSYTVTVTDSNGCFIIDTVIISEPEVLMVAISSYSMVSCNGGNDGFAAALASGGIVPYIYSWSSGSTASTTGGLSVGNYIVTVTDSNNCSAINSVTITEPLPLVIDISSFTNISCTGSNDGTATADHLGGIAPYMFLWSSGDTMAIVNNLSGGIYTVTVTDSNNCTGTDTIIISEPLELSADIISFANVHCNGGLDGNATVGVTGGTLPYTYLWSSGGGAAAVNNLSVGSYTIIVTDSNNCVSADSVIISQPEPMSLTIDSIPVVCTSNTGSATALASGGTAPYIYSWSSGGTTATQDSLTAGTYTISVTDVNGCFQNEQVTIASTNPLTLTVTATPSFCDTANGTATVTSLNGTSPYQYSWTTSPAQTSATASGLDAGIYTVTVTDSNGCIQSQSVAILHSTGPSVVVGATPTTITSGENTQLVAAGTGTYSWFPTAGLSCTSCPIPVASPSETTSYCVTVSDTSNCTDSACITIIVEIPCGKLEVPTAFSPNNDGHNDLFVLQGIDKCASTFVFMIFDRWGEKVFETESLTILSWDGTFKGKPLNSAVYVYYINATFINGETVTKKGNISLIR